MIEQIIGWLVIALIWLFASWGPLDGRDRRI